MLGWKFDQIVIILIGPGWNSDQLRWSQSVESNVGGGYAPATGYSTASLTPSVASSGPALSLDEEFFPLACIWGDSWKSESQPLLPGGHPAAKCISPHSQLYFRPINYFPPIGLQYFLSFVVYYCKSKRDKKSQIGWFFHNGEVASRKVGYQRGYPV